MTYKACGILIKQIHDSLERQANNTLRNQGLTMTQVNVLLLLNKAPNKQLSLKELEKVLKVAQSTTAGIISRLEQKEFIESFGDPSDKRIKLIKITALGEACCLNAKKNMDDAEKKLLSPLTKEEQDIFNILLQKVNNNMNVLK